MLLPLLLSLMRYNTLPSVPFPVPVIGQGCGKIDKGQPLDALLEGIERGMTLLDTAEAYNQGRSEATLGTVMQKIRSKIILASKVSPDHLEPHHVVEACERSLRRLKTDTIDLYQVHWPNHKIAIERTMTGLARLMDAGKIRMVGVCNFTLRELQRAEEAFRPYPIASVQAEYNLFDRSSEWSLIPFCQRSDKLFLAYSPLEQGTLVGNGERIETLKAIARNYDCTAHQIALTWLSSRSHVSVIPKAAKIDHVLENAAAGDIVLSSKDGSAISQLFSSRPLMVAPESIRVVQDGVDNRPAYQTMEEALENHLGLTPSPYELAQELQESEFLKPVRLRPTTDSSGRYEYDLIEGRLRYWAWVIAHEGKKPIPVLVRK